APKKASSSPSYATGHPSPAAGKILAEKGVTPSSVAGTGKDGRITKQDALSQTPRPSSPSPSPSPSLPGSGTREIERKKMSALRKTIAKRLVEAKNTTAMLTTFNEVDMSKVMELRKKYQDQFVKTHGIKLGFMSLFTKALTTSLSRFPGANAIIEGDDILYHRYADVGIAVSTPKGLVVPVVRNAESLPLHEIEKEIARLAAKAREGKLSIHEMTGGNITITNGGIFGSMMSTPILNIPQAAILGMHNIVERPMAVEGRVEIRPMMYLALSYDHRLIDGRESVGFLKSIKDLIEDPAKMILGL
ncbi:MAG: 2-oxoglutarate dehydrogenase complex dihydrolipoyllysine-residue succinyltransferase, partial [Bacteriovoracales bacterium]|nr:2-oxoglutarate dehydrogenase complex dihydrolipoyllysine-residue succinyltransferase [Bacteriovoracales bacterium]